MKRQFHSQCVTYVDTDLLNAVAHVPSFVALSRMQLIHSNTVYQFLTTNSVDDNTLLSILHKLEKR